MMWRWGQCSFIINSKTNDDTKQGGIKQPYSHQTDVVNIILSKKFIFFVIICVFRLIIIFVITFEVVLILNKDVNSFVLSLFL